MTSLSPPDTPFSALVKFPFFAENPAELSLAVGDTVTVLSTRDPGWWEGQSNVNGLTGLFPQNYVEVLKAFIPSKFPLPTSPPPLPAGGARGPKSPPLPPGRATATSVAKPMSPLIPIQRPQAVAALKAVETAAVPVVYHPTPVAYPLTSSLLSFSLRPNSTRFGHWAWNMALMTGFVNTILGIVAIMWYYNDPIDFTPLTQWIGVYTLLVSVAFTGVEYTRGLHRSEMPWPLRGLGYILISVPMYFTMPTLLGGVFTTTVGVANALACLLKEAYAPDEHKPPPSKPSILTKSPNFYQGLKQYWSYLQQQNKLGTVFFVTLYACGNIAIFTYQVIHWTQLNAAIPIAQQLSPWAPWAKGFGGLLDLNCALIVMPVCRTIIRWLYTRSTSDQGFVARSLRACLAFMPLDHNLSFHKLIAKVIMLATICHVLIHLINASLAYTNTLNKFGISPWWTGGVVSWCMLLMFAAVADNVKNKHHEIFMCPYESPPASCSTPLPRPALTACSPSLVSAGTCTTCLWCSSWC